MHFPQQHKGRKRMIISKGFIRKLNRFKKKVLQKKKFLVEIPEIYNNVQETFNNCHRQVTEKTRLKEQEKIRFPVKKSQGVKRELRYERNCNGVSYETLQRTEQTLQMGRLLFIPSISYDWSHCEITSVASLTSKDTVDRTQKEEECVTRSENTETQTHVCCIRH